MHWINPASFSLTCALSHPPFHSTALAQAACSRAKHASVTLGLWCAKHHQSLPPPHLAQRDLHQSILQLCHPEGSLMGAALAAAASGTSPGLDKPPAFPSGQQAQLVEQAEQQFAEELRQVRLNSTTVQYAWGL